MFNKGDLAVYPAHGVGMIESIEDKEISGNNHKFYIMRILDNNMIIMIPTNNANSVGLRGIIDAKAVAKIYEILSTRERVVEHQTWNRRYRDYMEKIKTGSLFQVAEVLRDLTLLKMDKDLSFGERKMLDTAKNLLIKELSIAKNKDEFEIEADIQQLLEISTVCTGSQ
jgi:CarD family transcriptional regulator